MFTVLGAELLQDGIIDCSAAAFAAARMQADRDAYTRFGRDGGVTHETIADHLRWILGVDTETSNMITERELAIEARMLQVVPAGSAAVSKARQRGHEVWFLSDMYLPQAFLRQQLQLHGLWHDGDVLLISGEAKASKHTGRLYHLVAERVDTTVDKIAHTGNDSAMDVRNARRQGLSAFHQPDANLTADEVALEATAGSSDGLGTALAGAARTARLTVPAAGPVEAARRDVAADVIGPLLIGYVLWVLHKAVDLKLDRLFFLSRDGQFLFELAKRLQPRLGPQVGDINLSYLMASREAWNIAALQGPVDEHLPWILSHPGEATLKGLLRRLGLTVDDPAVVNLLSRLGISHRAADQIPPECVRRRLFAALASSQMAATLQDAAERQRRLVTDAFAQAGVFDGPSGFVDVVARGTQQHAARQIVSAVGADPPIGLLAGIQRDKSLPPDVSHHLHAWLYDDHASVGIFPHLPVDILFIAACAADHGTLLGYAREDGDVVPVLRTEHNDPVTDWGLGQVRRTVITMAEALAVNEPGVDPRGNVGQPVVAGVRRLWSYPTPLEAEAWGTFPYEYGSGDEPRYNVLAPPMTGLSLVRRVLRPSRRHWSSWTQGSIARSRHPVRPAVSGALAVHRMSRTVTQRVAQRWRR